MNNSSNFHFFEIEKIKIIKNEIQELSQYIACLVENHEKVCTRQSDEKIQELWNQVKESKQQLEQIRQKLQNIENRPF